MSKPLDQITLEDFKAYERVRKSGKFNMFDSRAIQASRLDKDTYLGVISNYRALCEKFPEVRRLT